jgi:hypothetical protein
MAATCAVIGLLGGFAAAVPASTSFVSPRQEFALSASENIGYDDRGNRRARLALGGTSLTVVTFRRGGGAWVAVWGG